MYDTEKVTKQPTPLSQLLCSRCDKTCSVMAIKPTFILVRVSGNTIITQSTPSNIHVNVKI